MKDAKIWLDFTQSDSVLKSRPVCLVRVDDKSNKKCVKLKITRVSDYILRHFSPLLFRFSFFLGGGGGGLFFFFFF